MRLLTDEFLSQYPDQPEHMNELGLFVFYRTYSRWLEGENRRETWKEAVSRAVDYNVSISLDQFEKNKYDAPISKIRLEAETLFDNVFNLRQFLSGRTHWVGGASSGVGDKYPLSNFNCAFIDIVKWEDLCDLFYLLLVGTGVGFRGTKENIAKLPPIRTDYELMHSPYNPVAKYERLERTRVEDLGNGYAKIYVGDSKEGWVEALKWFLLFITDENFKNVKHIKINYNSVRPKGERLKTFGGTTSGYEPLKEMFEGIDKVFKGQMDEALAPLVDGHVRPVHILDIGNLIGNNVVVGGVRRTAELFLCDADDEETINAKARILEKEGLTHRYMSNNSICFNEKPEREYLHKIFELIKKNGEPGFINMSAAKKRLNHAKGVNPCAEILLDSHGVCNLTTVNVMAFVKDGVLDLSGLVQAQVLSVRAGIRMTCLDLELPEWDKVQKRDRLIGASVTGWKDAMAALGYSDEQEQQLKLLLRNIANKASFIYSGVLRIPAPLRITTVKPEGTLSQVAGGVSSGVHDSFAPYFIRRIRINADDALVKVAKELNWTIHEIPETQGKIVAIDFPIKSASTKTREDVSAVKQLENYFNFQANYTEHNASNTIHVRPDEWDDVEQMVWDRWDELIGVTFIPFDGGEYELAPYEAITEEQYYEMKGKMKPFSPDVLYRLESEQNTDDLTGMDECATGACPIR